MARTYTLKTRSESRLSVDYLSALNDEQRAVVTAPSGPLLVLAGAGSGKTRALTHRVVRFWDPGIAPDQIVLVTFTNRAAREMLARVEELVGSLAKRVRGGTFHHIANLILRQHAESLGFGDNFTILSRDDAQQVMSSAIIDAGVQVKKGRFPKSDVLIDIASHAINTQTPVDEVVAERSPRFYSLVDDIAAVCRAFVERKAAMNMMDFDDLLMNWKVLMEEVAPVGELIASQTRAILVDEFQDTNALQGEIVDRMAKVHRNVTVVGDDAQSIYRFRGADIHNMLDFEGRWSDAKRLSLTVNYRSTPQILAVANATLQHAGEGFKKELVAVRPEGVLPALVPCRDVFQQAEFIAQRILELRDEGVSLNDIAVLYRAHSHAMEIQVELMRRGIPFVVRSGLRFFEQAHIKDVIAHLRLLYNPDDELSFLRAVKLQEGVGNATADALWRTIAERVGRGRDHVDQGLMDALEEVAGRRAKAGVRTFVKVMRDIAKATMRTRPGEMVRVILDSFYGDYLGRRFPNARERQDDISQLADYADGFSSLEDFLAELSLVQDFVVEEPVAADAPDEKVTLSSVHQAKGLEWSRVFVVWLVQGRFPSDLSLREPGGVEEERRLFYVAATRARDELTLSHVQIHRQRDHTQVLMRRSQFLEEILQQSGEVEGLLETWLLQEEFVPMVEGGEGRDPNLLGAADGDEDAGGSDA
jgi:DNA helicase-2/ATP-dependent DNA helicase PcrA